MTRFARVVGLFTGFLALATTTGVAQSPSGDGRQQATHPDTKVPLKRDDAPPAIGVAGEASARDIAQQYLRVHAADLGLTSADVADVIVTSELLNEHSGVTHVYLRQRFNGIEVHGAVMNVNVAQDGRVFGVGSSFVPNLAGVIRGAAPVQDAAESAAAAAAHLGKRPKSPFAVIHARGGPAREVTLSDGGVSAAPIPARLVYEPLASGEVVLSWLMTIEDPDSSHVWEMSLDASTGELLEQTDLTDTTRGKSPTGRKWRRVTGAPPGTRLDHEHALRGGPPPVRARELDSSPC